MMGLLYIVLYNTKRTTGVQFPSRAMMGFFLSSPPRQDWLWVPPSLLSMGTVGSYPGDKAAGTWSWSLTSIQCRG